MVSSKSQKELEEPVKGYELQAVADKIDAFRELYVTNTNTFTQAYITRADHHAELQDAVTASEKAMAIICTDVTNLKTTIGNLKKFGYSMALLVGGLLINLVWQYITNSGKL